MPSDFQLAEERVRRGFHAFWSQMQLGPPLSSGLPIKCPSCYPIPGRTQGLALHRCPLANPLILVDTPETRNFYPCPTAVQAPPVRVPPATPQSSPSMNTSGPQKRKSSGATSPDPETYTDCLLCEKLYLVPGNLPSDDPEVHTCKECLQRLDGVTSGTSSTASASTNKKPRNI